MGDLSPQLTYSHFRNRIPDRESSTIHLQWTVVEGGGEEGGDQRRASIPEGRGKKEIPLPTLFQKIVPR